MEPMKIDAVDFFYLSMPEVTTEADGSQDALLVRVRAGGFEGWGECEASPLASIAAFVCPMSHGVCQPVRASVTGQTLEGPQDIKRIAALVEYNSMDLLQAAHTFSGIEMALWDVLGKARDEPVWKLLGYKKVYPKIPYASQLFGDTPQQTQEAAQRARRDGFRAVKFGWGPFGRSTVKADNDQLAAAREGLGKDGILLVDAGQIFRTDEKAASKRLAAMKQAKVTWFEEPFHSGAYGAYAALARKSGVIKVAGGEAAHNVSMALQLMEYGKVGFIQIDCGRIGGIGPAREVAAYAVKHGVTYVNHTFTSHLALSASLQPYAGLAKHTICEYPFAPKSVVLAYTRNYLKPDGNGHINVPQTPGLGIDINIEGIRKYLVKTEIRVNGAVLYATPTV
jgi:L-alanine-DL-glutamate epimerase-like enolase superfamily enzyme